MAQQGFVYEEKAYAALNKAGPLKVDISTGGVAKSSADKPDMTIHRHGKSDGVELKISPTAAGSLVMKYVQPTGRGRGKWIYGSLKDKSGSDMPEKVFISGVGEEMNLLREMNTSGTYGKKWREHPGGARKTPALQIQANGSKCFGAGCNNIRESYVCDIANYGKDNEIKIVVPASKISDYYNKKKTHYLNVGTHGFFLLNSDPLGLSAKMVELGHDPIPDFGKGENAKCMIRVRVQDKSKSGPLKHGFIEGHLLDAAEDRVGGYQFTMTLQFSGVKTSPYNIAPIVSTKDVNINLKRLRVEKLLQAWL